MDHACIAKGNNRPHVMVMRDDKCQSKLEYLNVACDEGNLNCTYIRNKVDFLVKNVIVTCILTNALFNSLVRKELSMLQVSKDNFTII